MNLLKTDKKALLKKRSEKALGIFSETIEELKGINLELWTEREVSNKQIKLIEEESKARIEKLKAEDEEMRLQQEQNGRLVSKLEAFTQF